MLIVLDTSVLIAFLLSRGISNSSEIIRLAKDKKLRLAASKETLKELKQTLSLVTIKKLPGYKARTLASFIAWYQYNVEYFTIVNSSSSKQIRDTSDAMFLELARISQADYIISGDNDLLVLKHIRKTKIITAAEFVEIQRKLGLI